MRKTLAIGLLTLAATGPSWAYELTNARVTVLQSTYMPAKIAFTVDTGTPSCPAGTWLFWSNSNTDNNKATYATLLAALTSGSKVTYYVNDGDTACTVLFLDILSP
jgi:hypothetical protein